MISVFIEKYDRHLFVTVNTLVFYRVGFLDESAYLMNKLVILAFCLADYERILKKL